MESNILKIGHRGAAGYEPENTLLSFQKALDLGADAVELDVYVCKTGELVVIHDDKVDRTTNGKGNVVEKSFDEIKSLDAGKGQKVPTLQEVLDLVNKQVIVNIELKGPDTAEPVSKTIEKYIKEKGWKENSFIISSFEKKELEKFRELNSVIRVGVLIEKESIDYAEFAKKINAYSVNPSLDISSKEFVDDAHKKGLKVFVWAADDDKTDEMKKNGVDGIFSNFPDRI